MVSRGDLSKGLGQVQLCLLCLVVLCKVSDKEQEGGLCNQRAALTLTNKSPRLQASYRAALCK